MQDKIKSNLKRRHKVKLKAKKLNKQKLINNLGRRVIPKKSELKNKCTQ